MALHMVINSYHVKKRTKPVIKQYYAYLHRLHPGDGVENIPDSPFVEYTYVRGHDERIAANTRFSSRARHNMR